MARTAGEWGQKRTRSTRRDIRLVDEHERRKSREKRGGGDMGRGERHGYVT